MTVQEFINKYETHKINRKMLQEFKLLTDLKSNPEKLTSTKKVGVHKTKYKFYNEVYYRDLNKNKIEIPAVIEDNCTHKKIYFSLDTCEDKCVKCQKKITKK